ncbi:MAG: hypothetical protein DLM50_04070 [Candidatus Meridianibacter frigidus]|nr:MAG: hypothetical protein DLM50_04070 [Candidatus Eremiobacteraeota bacterium]
MKHQLVDAQSGLEQLCRRVACAARVGLDTEFHNERSYVARLMVVQLAFEEDVVIVDPLRLPELRPLVEALGKTLVVGHALTSDLKIFADRFGAAPDRVFDTQIAAAFCGYGLSVSLADLVHDIAGVRLKKSQTVSDWSARPLSSKQTEYLTDDVAHLLELHDKLTKRLEESGRLHWALEECRLLGQLERYQVDLRKMYLRIPGATRMNRRELGVLRELVALREATARRRDVPLKYVLPDDVVAGLVALRPQRVEDLAQLRRLDAGARKSLGQDILAAVRLGESIAEEELPVRPTRPLGNQRDGLVAVMNVLIGEIARANGLPATLLVPRASLERVARELPESFEGMQAMLELEPWRTQLVAEPLWRLLSGESSLRIEGRQSGDPRISFS